MAKRQPKAWRSQYAAGAESWLAASGINGGGVMVMAALAWRQCGELSWRNSKKWRS
jgi:hypothetical protein